MADSYDSNANANSSSSFPLPALPTNLPISVKLTESNFLIWQQQVEATIWGYGLESFLTGEGMPAQTSTTPGTTTTLMTPEALAWKRQDQRLAAWLMSSLSEAALIQVVGLKTTKDIWKALQTNFASQSKAKMMHYRMQLQNTKKANMPMQEYLNKMKSCLDFLGSAGSVISEQDQILFILGGLSQDYNSILVSISSRCEPWTVQEVSALLLGFESRLSEGTTCSGSMEGTQPYVNLAQQSSQKRENQSAGQAGQSHRGGFAVSGRGNFRSPRGGRGGRSYGGSKLICQLCQKPGHGADKCWYRYEPSNSVSSSRGVMQQHSFQQPSAHLVQSRPPMGTSPSVMCPSEYSYDSSNATTWFPDSGATNHVTNDLHNLNLSSEYSGGKKLALGDGFEMNIAHIGETILQSGSSLSSRKLMLKNLLHVPNITKNLLSVSQFAQDNSVFFEFHPFSCFVKDQASKEVVLKGTLDNGLYKFVVHHSNLKKDSAAAPLLFNQAKVSPAAHSASLASPAAFSSISSTDVATWHNRLGHPSFDIVKSALSNCNIHIKAINSSSLCHSCCISKSHRLPHSLSTSECSSPFNIVHTDLWGPSPVTSRNGYKYYVTFIDQFSRYTWIYLLKNKSDVHSVFRQFKLLVENLFSNKIKILQSDWGGEFQALSGFLKESGISHRISCPYTPQQNGLAERKHRHIVETGLALLAHSGLPPIFWDDAFCTASFLINLMPSKVIDNLSPHEKLHKTKPDYTSLRTFGCLGYPFLRPDKHGICIFLRPRFGSF